MANGNGTWRTAGTWLGIGFAAMGGAFSLGQMIQDDENANEAQGTQIQLVEKRVNKLSTKVEETDALVAQLNSEFSILDFRIRRLRERYERDHGEDTAGHPSYGEP